MIEQRGGRITRDENDAGKPIVKVDLRSTETNDADLKKLIGLKELGELLLHDTRITDRGLKEVAALPKLRVLYLAAPQVTDAGSKELAPLEHLDSTRVVTGVA